MILNHTEWVCPGKRSTPPCARAGERLVLDQALALGPLTREFPSAAHSFGFLAGFLFRRLLEMGPSLHFPEEALSLHLFLQRAEGVFDIVVADDDLNDD